MTENMNRNEQVLDAPLKDPDDDLLGMRHYAEKLAEFIVQIRPPFTIGIYGEWGSGKTSFVNFTRTYLTNTSRRGEPVLFISFSAWPYRTSDELWRALIMKIAQVLYGVSDEQNEEEEDAPPVYHPRNFSEWFANLLSNDAIVFRNAPSSPDPLADYKALRYRLDTTYYSGINKNPQNQAQLDQEAVLLATVQAVAAALSAMSPLVAGARALFGLDRPIELSGLLHKEKNEVVRERIEGLQAFRGLFRDLFAARAEGKRVCVFIDDLDRCMPDVALDILEAIKVLLEDVPCVFIVAADERLIGQGLRLRYSALLEQTNEENSRAFFSEKGQEYFEKIIQLSIRVPARTERQIHSFIAAQFPEWMPITDIVQTALGDNPRRIKQYCNWLTYKYLVWQIQKDGV